MSEKKSEKVEIRLSYEEKQNLTEAAETEGRTVSDLVRGLINRYIKTTSARLPEPRIWKRLWISWLGFGVAAFLAGHLATWAYAKHHKHAPDIYSLNVNVGNARITTPVLEKDGYTSKYTLADDDGDVQLSITVENKDNSLASVRTDICRKTGDNCINIASPVLHMNPRQAAIININDNQKDEIYVTLMRPPQ